MNQSVDVVDMPDQLTAFDALMHRGEANPRTRSGIMAIQVLESAPEWNRFRDLFDNASRRIPRMRQKVVVPTLPTTAPRWVVDPDFDLTFHVRRIRVQGNIDVNNLFNSAAVQNLNFTYGASWLQPTLVQPGRALVLSTQLDF